MALNFPKLPTLGPKDAKSRILFVVAGVVGIGFVGYALFKYFEGGGKPIGPSKVVNAATNLRSVPGGQTSSAYYQTLAQANTQATQKAEMTGGSAVPTLVNIPDQDTNFGQGANCTVMCPGEDNVNVSDALANLVKEGKITQEEADKLNALAKKSVSVEEYAAALNNLVKQGKLSPEQARKLLEDYKKQHGNASIAESAAAMDSLIKSGQLPVDVANDLLAFQKKNPSIDEYAAELSRLVKEGKISQATAAQLLGQYTQQQKKELAKKGAFNLAQMVSSGQVTPDVANSLAALQAKNTSVDQYAAELNRLVKEGKLTPAAAMKLLDDYKKQKTGPGQTGTLAELLNQGGAKAEEAKKLLALQGNNASLSSYSDELKRAVQQGILTPDMAAKLLQEYRASLMAVGAPGPETVLPGTEDFAKLQQEVQKTNVAQQPTTQADQEFEAAQAQALEDAEQAKQQRIQALATGMSTQAQQLIVAWQPSIMQHKGGVSDKETSLEEIARGKSRAAVSKDTSSSTTQSLGVPIIKAGSILFAVLDTAVDSDYPDTPVMATIIQGPFKGAKLLGKVQTGKGPNQEKLGMIFNLMGMDNWPNNKTINAFAIDPDTARTVMASDVDHHYVLRYGAIMATSFISGYASAITNAGSTQTTGIFGTSTVSPQLSPGNKLAVGIGQIGTNLGSSVQNYANTPVTVKVNSGVGLGILFMSDVTQ